MSRGKRTRLFLAGLCAIVTTFGGVALAAPLTMTALGRGVDLGLLVRSPSPAFALEVAWSALGVLRGLARPWMIFIAALSFAYLLPLGARIVAADLARAKLGAQPCLRAALARLPVLALLFGLVTIFKAVVLVVTSALVGYGLTPAGEDETQNLIAFFGVLGVAALVHVLVRIVHDVARVYVLQAGLGPLSSLASALRHLLREHPRLWVSAGWRLALELALMVTPILVVASLPSSSVSRVLASAVLGQAAILVSLLVRLSFFDVVQEQTVARPRPDAVSPRLVTRPGSSVGRAED